jgi:hypothetical protein
VKLAATLFAGVVLGCSAHVAARAQGGTCQWPMHAVVQAPALRDYPTSVLLVFTKPEPGGDLIHIREVTTVGLAKLVDDFPSMVRNSDGWGAMQSRLNCNDRAGDFSYGLGVVEGRLHATFGVNVEKYWCASSMVPCPVFPADPLRMCRKEANGKVWGARVSSTSRIELRQDGLSGFQAVVVDTTTSSNTSHDQNFMRDLLGASFMGPLGIEAIRKMESSVLDAIKSSMRDGFDNQMFQLADGSSLPVFPNYRPTMKRLGFVNFPLGGIGAQIEREISSYRESTGCALALQMKAIHVSTATRSGRGR